MDNNENNNEELNTLTLTFDNDLVVDCEVVATFEVEEKEYIALLPVEEIEGIDPEELFIYRYIPTDDVEDVHLESIEDDDEYDNVVDALEKLIEEAEDFDDEDVADE